MSDSTTIAAISTPPGVGAIGIVRLSGPRALDVAAQVFRPSQGGPLREQRGYTARLGRVVDGAGGGVDDAVALVYRAPKSYTGEDVVELSCHGGSYAVRRTLRLCLDAGAHPAQPGEFTKRAFLNGKLDLNQAEAVMDLIGAQGDAAMKAALSARDGALSTATADVVEKLLAGSSHIAAWSDYPEEDLAPVDEKALAADLEQVQDALYALLDTYDRGRVLREGALTAIVGKPNVGKSTLMNLLAGFERSIVTDIPGTTRDVVQDTVVIGGAVLNLTDTAGVRDTGDTVERIGVERTLSQIELADLVLAVFDSSDALDAEDERLLELLHGKSSIAIINKIDLPQKLDVERVRGHIGRVAVLSAKTGDGRDELESLVAETLELDRIDPTAAMVASERQRTCLQEAHAAVADALDALGQGMTLDAVGVCIDSALDALLSLSGRRATDAVVDEVFARFCVGK